MYTLCTHSAHLVSAPTAARGAHRLAASETTALTRLRRAALAPHYTCDTQCGTDQYAPPEVVYGEGRSVGADWWALGVLLHEMLTGHSPFEGHGMKEIFTRIAEYAKGGEGSREALKGNDAPRT